MITGTAGDGGFIRLETNEVREKLENAIALVAFDGSRIILEEAGKEVAAIIPMQEFVRLEELKYEIHTSLYDFTYGSEYFEDVQPSPVLSPDEVQANFDYILKEVIENGELVALVPPLNIRGQQMDIFKPVAILIPINKFWVSEYFINERNRLMNVQPLSSTPEPAQILRQSTVILKGITWNTFKAMIAEVGDDRAWRIAYDQGVLEIRMPYQQHEVPKRLLEDFVTAIADELDIETMELGALLLEREDLRRAIEPDTCFYIQNESLVRSKIVDLETDPPPDLAVESDYSNSSLNKFNIYASLGVPELWRYRNQKLEVYHLVEGTYELRDRSLAFPFLPIAEVPGFIQQSKTIGQRAAVRLFRQRIREILPA